MVSFLSDSKSTTVTRPADVLLVSTDPLKQNASFPSETYRIHYVDVDNLDQTTLGSAEYDLVILDDGAFNDELPLMVQEIKRCCPQAQVLAWLDDNNTYHDDILSAGIDHILSDTLTWEEIHHRLLRMLDTQQTSTPRLPAATDLLNDLQQFAGLPSVEAVLNLLYEQITAVTNDQRVLVWLSSNDNVEFITHAAAFDLVAQMNQRQLIARHIVSKFDDTNDPVYFELKRGLQNPVGPLFRGLMAQQLIALPITVDGIAMGTVVTGAQHLPDDTISLIETLIYSAELTLKHLQETVKHDDSSQTFATLLGKVSDAVFVLDADNIVSYCNAQFITTLGDLTGQPITTLVNALAASDDKRTQLEKALHCTDTYSQPIPVTVQGQRFDLEMLLLDDDYCGGILHQQHQPAAVDRQTFLLDALMEQINLPYRQVRNAIASLAEEHRRFNPRELSTYLRHIEANMDDVRHLWENFKELYDLEISGLRLNYAPFNLGDLLNDVISRRPFSQYPIQINTPSDMPMINADAYHIEQAIINVLQNAVDFSPEGAPIQIELTHNKEEATIIVQDQGIGIPTDQIRQVVAPLFRASNNLQQKGAGIGLYLTDNLIASHGGRLVIESDNNSGTRVHLTLPIEKSAPVMMEQHTPVAPSQPTYPTAPIIPPVTDTPRIASTDVNRVPERGLQTIMLINNSSRFLNSAAARLSENGYDLLTYHTINDALRDIKLTRFDLILMDADMSDSLTACEWIRKQSEVPILLLGSDNSEAERVHALNMGADDYLVLPISEAEFMARINVIFKRQRIPDRTRAPLELGDIRIDFARREVYLKDQPVEMTRIQYELLHALAVNRGQVLTHKQLLEKVWGPEYQGETQYLWVNISRLRKKLEPNANEPRYIHNVPGIGYMFKG